VYVGGHPAIREDRQRIPLTVAEEQSLVDLTVVHVKERLAATNASLRDVMRKTWHNDSLHPSHLLPPFAPPRPAVHDLDRPVAEQPYSY